MYDNDRKKNRPGTSGAVQETVSDDTASMDQHDLFSAADAEDGERQLTTAERFELFHNLNPLVYEVLVRLAREWINRTGRRKLGIATLVERARWDIVLRTSDPDFKINNNFQPFYARAIMVSEGDLADLFDLRRSVADEWISRQAA